MSQNLKSELPHTECSIVLYQIHSRIKTVFETFKIARPILYGKKGLEKRRGIFLISLQSLRIFGAVPTVLVVFLYS